MLTCVLTAGAGRLLGPHTRRVAVTLHCCLFPLLLLLLPPQEVELLVVTMHAAFEDSFMRGEDLWADYLVPPGPAPVSIRTSELAS